MVLLTFSRVEALTVLDVSTSLSLAQITDGATEISEGALVKCRCNV